MARFRNLEFNAPKPQPPPVVGGEVASSLLRDGAYWMKLADQSRRTGVYEIGLKYYSRALELDRTLVPGWLGQVQMLVDPPVMLVGVGMQGEARGATHAQDAPRRRSLTGRLLVASDSMRDPRFARVVIYLVRHNEEGALGLVPELPGGRRARDCEPPPGAVRRAAGDVAAGPRVTGGHRHRELAPVPGAGGEERDQRGERKATAG